jgi:DNA-binding transcriptional ArsR family regulator
LRIQLTVQDLTRIGLGCADPLFELTASLQLLQTRTGSAAFTWWKRWIRHRVPESARMLTWLCRPGHPVPGFLLPFAGSPDLEAALAVVRETRPERLGADVLLAADGREPPNWVSALVDGDSATLTRLVQALRDYFEAAVAPHWPVIRAQVDADRDQRTRILVGGGVSAMLNSLRPMLAWSIPAPTETGGAEPGLHFHEARIVLLPAFFVLTPVIVTTASQPVRLAYPSIPLPGRVPGKGGPAVGNGYGKALADLLGPTRAAALQNMADGCSTTELATRLGVTPSAISRHTSVLRQAGLIITRRDRNTARHSLTPLGNALLDS